MIQLLKNPHQYSLLLIMNYKSSSFGSEGSWNKTPCKGQKADISLKVLLIFLSFVYFKRGTKQNCIYKLSSEDKIFSSLIMKRCRTCTFLNHFRETNEHWLSPCFNKVDFVVIPCYIELHWSNWTFSWIK